MTTELKGWHWAIARHDQLRKEITERAARYAKQREAKCPSNA